MTTGRKASLDVAYRRVIAPMHARAIRTAEGRDLSGLAVTFVLTSAMGAILKSTGAGDRVPSLLLAERSRARALALPRGGTTPLGYIVMRSIG